LCVSTGSSPDWTHAARLDRCGHLVEDWPDALGRQ
jgi:hypothetical protein